MERVRTDGASGGENNFERALQTRHAAVERLLAIPGDGDLGESVVTADGRRMEQSEEPAERPLRTVLGEHTLRAYVYAARAHQAIELRPVGARVSLPAGRYSYFFEEFWRYFCVEQAFGQAWQGWRWCCGKKILAGLLILIGRGFSRLADRSVAIRAASRLGSV